MWAPSRSAGQQVNVRRTFEKVEGGRSETKNRILYQIHLTTHQRASTLASTSTKLQGGTRRQLHTQSLIQGHSCWSERCNPDLEHLRGVKTGYALARCAAAPGAGPPAGSWPWSWPSWAGCCVAVMVAVTSVQCFVLKWPRQAEAVRSRVSFCSDLVFRNSPVLIQLTFSSFRI